MPVDRVVINASPLIILFRSNLEKLLPQLFKEIVVPGSVWREIVDGGHTDRAASCLPGTTWVKRVDNTPEPSVTAWDVGPGETAVISFALTNQGFSAILDDTAARNCSSAFGIPTLGTAGLLLVAKKRGIIDSVAEPLQSIRDNGLYFSDSLVTKIMKNAGEDY